MADNQTMEPDSRSGPPRHRLIVLPFLRRPGARLIMPNWLAITIGRWIFAWRPLDQAELAHELAHVRQWRANGLRFIPRYLGASRAARNSGGDGYRDNHFEIEAAAAATEAIERTSHASPNA